MKTIQSHTGKSGAYIEPGIREMQVYAGIGREGLVLVLELDTDCPGQVFTYFMRGGIVDSAMTVPELEQAALAFADLLSAAREAWPRFFKPPKD